MSVCLSQNSNNALFQQFHLWREGGREAATSLWPLGPWQGKRDRPWLRPFRTHQRPMVVRSAFHCASGQVPQAALISWHTNPHRRQRSALGQCREPGAVNQHWCCERPTISFQSAEWVRELPGWFVAWSLLSISLEITAGGGPQPGSTHTALSPVHLSGNRARMRQREKNKPSAPLPHSSNTLTGNFAASRALYDNPGSSSALISATKVHLRFSLSTIFLNNAISAAITPSTSHIILSPGDRRTQAWHTSPAALFTLASAPGLAVAPLHFHINSSKAWWNQRCAAGGGERIENHYTVHFNSPPHWTQSHIADTAAGDVSWGTSFSNISSKWTNRNKSRALIYETLKVEKKERKKEIAQWSHIWLWPQFKCD